MDGSHDRRTFLLLAAGTAAAAAVPARAATSRPSLDDLERRLRGRLVTRRDPGYADAKRLWNPRLDVPPRAIAFCAGADDVAKVLRFAARRDWPVAPRSGRHSFAGYGNARGGIVADVSELRDVVLNRREGTVRIGAGATVLDLYRELVLARDAGLPLGTCPTVGMAGLTLGGGVSHLVRRAGFLVDSLRSVDLVLPDGRRVTCDERRHRDLFWACRGGGGGNFGVATAFELAVQPPRDVVRFALTFDWAKASAAFDAWQRSLPDASDDLAYARFRAFKHPDGSLTATVSGHWYGSEADLGPVLAPLQAVGPRTATVRPLAFAAAWRPDGCRVDASGQPSCEVPRRPRDQRSDFVAQVLPAESIAGMLGWIERWPGGGPDAHEGGVQIEALGTCAANRVAPDATAFVHRSARFHIEYLAIWGPSDPPEVAAANQRWLRDFHGAMRPWMSGEAYQNYIDPTLADWERAYYGANLRRLRAVKRRYDPDGVLDFAQGI